MHVVPNNNHNNNNNHLQTNAQCSHQCQGFHATPGNTPTLWGGSASSTKYPHDSSRPPTPSFPPYDVRTLHFVACGRPWLLHWRGVHTHRSWSLPGVKLPPGSLLGASWRPLGASWGPTWSLLRASWSSATLRSTKRGSVGSKRT